MAKFWETSYADSKIREQISMKLAGKTACKALSLCRNVGGMDKHVNVALFAVF